MVATPLADPLVVKVKARSGTALPGVVVTFAVTAGGATLSRLTAVTDSAGNASTNLTLGTIAGSNTVSASATNIGSVSFTESAVAGAASKLALSPATAITSAGVAVSYKAAIQDVYGNTVSTETNPVSFTATGLAGSFSPAERPV